MKRLLQPWLLAVRFFVLLASLTMLLPTVAEAAIVYIGASSGRNDTLPTDGSAGALTIARPAGVSAGNALIATIAPRPRSMTVTVPSGWTQMTFTNQNNGGVSTAPGGMSLITYYKVASTTEPANYTWTFANPANGGGGVVGGILAFSGVDTGSGIPIDGGGTVWSANLTASGTTHATTSINTTVANTMIVSSISYLSAGNFANPTSSGGLVLTERLDQSAPLAAAAIGVTLQMSTAPLAAIGATGTTRAVANGNSDTGVSHLMALRPSTVDQSLAMVRNSPLNPGGTSSYTLTVTNGGTTNEPGPLTVVNTLPSGLTYVSASGSGWSCSLAGQVVTCIRTGTLTAGATAPALTINVSVAIDASGTLTNTATVSGTGGDGNTANNTAVDNYVIPTAAYAYYALDESSWGSIADASGNGRNASVLGSATPTGSVVPSPPGSAIAGSPGTCGAGVVPNGTSSIGINTSIDPNNMGNAGTIAFWYSSNTSWNDGNSRILFDASNDLGNSSADRHFFLVKDGSGILRFSLKDSASTTSTVATVSYGYPSNQWHHVVVTWDVGASSIKLYLDGVLAATSNTALNGTLGNTATLYFGAQRMAGVTGTPTGYTSNTANGYLDELRLYSSALSALEIDYLYGLTHTCSTGIDHYQLSLPTNAISCLASTVTVTACTNTSSPCTSAATTVNGQTATLGASAGSLASTTVTFNASGVASTTLSHAAAANGASVTVSVSGEQTLASSPRQCCPNGIGCSASNSCAITFNTAGFIFSSTVGGAVATLPTQTAGTSSSTYYLRAIQTGTTTKACEAALSGSTTVNFGYECNNPTTCSTSNLLTLNGGVSTTIARNNNGSVTSYLPVNMTFDANGNAPFTFNFGDVGQIKLYATKAPSGSLLSTLSGASNAFVTKPGGFVLSGIRCTTHSSSTCAPALAAPGDNPGALNAAGPAFIQAGQGFSATVTATTTGGVATPNYGKEISPEGVRLTAALVLPSGGASPTLNNASAFGSFAAGVATGTNFNWPEVGIIALTPSVADADYLGVGNVTGTTSSNVGRFIAANFALSAPSVAQRLNAGCTPASTFTYLGENFGLGFTLTARNSAGATTTNYHASFAKLDPSIASNWALAGIDSTTIFSTGGSARLSLGTSAGSWNNGVAAGITLSAAALRGAAPDGPFNAVFGIAPSDSDGALVAAYDLDTDSPANGNDRATVGTVPLRFGRLRLSNAIGAQDRDLGLPMQAQYWSGGTFLTNTSDSCTQVPATAVNFGNYRKTITNADTSVSGNVTLANGSGTLVLTKPAAGHTGTFDVALSLGSTAIDASCMQPWTPGSGDAATLGAAVSFLRGAWCGSSHDKDPSARASFGLYRGADSLIYQRENY